MDNVEATLEVARDSREDFIAGLIIVGLGILGGGFIGYGLAGRDMAAIASKAYSNGFVDGHNVCGRRFVEMLHAYNVPMPDSLARDVAAGKVPLLQWDTSKPAAGTPAW